MQNTASEPARLCIHSVIGDLVTGLRHHLRTKLASEQDVEDIAQEACLKLLQASGKASDIRNPKAYLHQIARHLLYHHYVRLERLPEVADVHVDELLSADESVECLTMDSLRRQRINHAIRELPPKCQRALFLRWREGLRVAEVAEQMGLSRSMVKKYLATGLAHFRRRLGRIA